MKKISKLFILLLPAFISCDDGGSGNSAGNIAFHTDRDGNFEIYFMGESGGNLERVTFNNIPDRNPSLATQAGTLVFTETIGSFLQTLILESDTLRNLTDEALDDRTPSISADGNRLAFVRDENIYVMNVDGSGLLNLTGQVEGAVHSGPAFSADGGSIVFARSLSGGFADVLVVDVGGTGLTNLTDSEEHDDVFPSFSRDDSEIVFVWDRHVSVMNADGSNFRDLMPNDTSVYNGHPVFSPDGEKIAFSSDRQGNREIYIMNADGGNVLNITESPSEDDYPTWRD